MRSRFYIISVLVVFMIYGCQSAVTYELPGVPLGISVSLEGVEVGLTPSVATPIGVFSLEIGERLLDFRQENPEISPIPRVLMVRVDQEVYVYSLEKTPLNLKFQYDERYFRSVNFSYNPGDTEADIIIELETVSILNIITQESSGSAANKALSSNESMRPASPCDGSPKRLQVGSKAQVCTWRSGENVRIRSEPRENSTEIARLVPGAVVDIIGGPVCDPASRWWYWKIETQTKHYIGWMAEGGDEKDPYFLCPYP